jgi:hypothetical protein
MRQMPGRLAALIEDWILEEDLFSRSRSEAAVQVA